MPANSPFPTNARIAAYLRDSGHEEQELSVEQQEARIRAWCLEHGLILSAVYTDVAAPGSSTIGRDRFLEMIHAFRDPACTLTGIIVWKYNRFARDIDDAQFYKADLRRRGFIIHSLNDQVPEGLDGRFFEAAIDWMNARYLDDLSADVKRGQRHLIDNYSALGGTPPRGFIRATITLPPHRDGVPHLVHKWIPDPAQVDAVLAAFTLRASGASYDHINSVTHFYKATTAYHRFFSNKLYIGVMEFSGQSIPDYCDPIVPLDLWNTVQAVQARSRQAVSKTEDHPRRGASTALLSGLAYCALCGSVLNFERVAFRTTARYRYEYYTCTGISRHACAARKIPRAPLENAVIETLAEIILDPAYLAALREQRLRILQDRKKERAAARKRLSQTLAAVRTRIRNVTDTIADGGSAVRSLAAKLAELEQQETSLLTQLDAFAKPPAPVPSLDELTQRAQLLRDQLANIDDPGRASVILRGMLSRVTVSLDPQAKKITGSLDYFDPLNAPGASYDAPDTPLFSGYTLCPGRDLNSQPRR